jgi:hypothetical protein
MAVSNDNVFVVGEFIDSVPWQFLISAKTEGAGQNSRSLKLASGFARRALASQAEPRRVRISRRFRAAAIPRVKFHPHDGISFGVIARRPAKYGHSQNRLLE